MSNRRQIQAGIDIADGWGIGAPRGKRGDETFFSTSRKSKLRIQHLETTLRRAAWSRGILFL